MHSEFQSRVKSRMMDATLGNEFRRMVLTAVPWANLIHHNTNSPESNESEAGGRQIPTPMRFR